MTATTPHYTTYDNLPPLPAHVGYVVAMEPEPGVLLFGYVEEVIPSGEASRGYIDGLLAEAPSVVCLYPVTRKVTGQEATEWALAHRGHFVNHPAVLLLIVVKHDDGPATTPPVGGVQ